MPLAKYTYVARPIASEFRANSTCRFVSRPAFCFLISSLLTMSSLFYSHALKKYMHTRLIYKIIISSTKSRYDFCYSDLQGFEKRSKQRARKICLQISLCRLKVLKDMWNRRFFFYNGSVIIIGSQKHRKTHKGTIIFPKNFMIKSRLVFHSMPSW